MFHIKRRKYCIILLLFLAFPVWAKDDKTVLYNQGYLIITKAKATYKGRVLYDAVKEQKKQKKQAGEGDIVNIYTPLSLIGPYYSYQTHVYQLSGSDGSKSSSYYCFHTVNITSNAPVSILDLVVEASLVAALKKDTWVRKYAQGKLVQLDSCKTLQELLQVTGIGDGFENKFDANSFTFFKLNPKNGLVAVWLLGNEGFGYDNYHVMELGLWVKPKADFKKFFGLRFNFYYGQYEEISFSEAL